MNITTAVTKSEWGGPGSPGDPRDPRPLVALRDARVRLAPRGAVLLEVPRLEIAAGERLVITGASGSGKSLLLSSLAGRWAPGLRFEGSREARSERIGFVPQRGLDALHPLSPLDRQLRRVTGAAAGRVAEVLRAVGLSDPELHRRRPAELSGGQAQRAAIALAVLAEAPLILADEPTSALDRHTRDGVLRLLDEMAGEHRALVVTTHDPEVARVLATRHIRVTAGRVAEVPLPATASPTPMATPSPAAHGVRA